MTLRDFDLAKPFIPFLNDNTKIRILCSCKKLNEKYYVVLMTQPDEEEKLERERIEVKSYFAFFVRLYTCIRHSSNFDA